MLDYQYHPSPRYGHGKSAHRELYSMIEKKRSKFEQYLNDFASFQKDFMKIPLEESDEASVKPYWNNGFFPGLDAVSLHCILCMQGPKTFCEIGSGHSTRFARHAIRLHQLATQIISIDPQPRAELIRSVIPLCVNPSKIWLLSISIAWNPRTCSSSIVLIVRSRIQT